MIDGYFVVFFRVFSWVCIVVWLNVIYVDFVILVGIVGVVIIIYLVVFIIVFLLVFVYVVV